MHITFYRDGNLTRVRRMTWAASRRNMRRIWILSAIFLVLGALMIAVSGPLPGAILVGIGAAYTLLPVWAVSRHVRRVSPLFAETAQYTITDTDVTVQTETSTLIFRWPGFNAVREVGGFFLCMNKAKVPAVAIPQDCMSPEDLLALRTFLAARGAIPAEYRL